jgi:nitrile hydratase
MHGFGSVEVEENEPPFHEPWEGRVLALQRATWFLGLWTLDGFRASMEELPPLSYLASSYYERWFHGVERLVLGHDLVGKDEIEAGHSLHPERKVSRKFTTADVPIMTKRGNYERPPHGAARFRKGDQVRTRNIHPTTHTRLPRYARDKLGVVEAVRGCHVYPDTAATGAGEKQQWLYTVVFTAQELWGDEANIFKVSIEAFEPYLTLA